MTEEQDWSWSDVKSDVRPRTDTVDLVLDGNIADALEHAQAALRQAERDNDTLDGSTVQEAQDEVDRLTEQAEASTRTFTVVSVGYRRWRELVEASPPRDEAERWDPTTFVPAVLAECCEQFTSEADVEHALDVLTSGQVAKLFAAARVVNEGDDRVPTLRGR